MLQAAQALQPVGPETSYRLAASQKEAGDRPAVRANLKKALASQTQNAIDEIRAKVEEGLSNLTAASRKAAQEVEAADAAFQERIKRNHNQIAAAGLSQNIEQAKNNDFDRVKARVLAARASKTRPK